MKTYKSVRFIQSE